MVQGVLQAEGLRAGIGAVERAHGADHDFAREDAADEADADLPVEAERRDGRLDEVADVADDAVGKLRRRVENRRGGEWRAGARAPKEQARR